MSKIIGTYSWSFVPQTFHDAQPSHYGNCKTFKMVTSALPLGTLASVASLLAATLYQGILKDNTNSGISYQLRDIYSISRYWWNFAIHKWKGHNTKIEAMPFVVKFFPNRPSL